MARPGPRRPPAAPRPAPEGPPGATPPPGLLGAAEPDAAALGEGLRRVALGATAALLAARAYWPENEDGTSGLVWVLLLLATLGLAIVAMWLRRDVSLRVSVTDVALIVLAVLVGVSVSQAADRRAGITTAWEIIGGVVAYLLLRNLPRGRAEASALAGGLVATAAALAALGFYQVGVEDPDTRAMYRRDPARALQLAGVPDDPASRRRFEDRLLQSTEPRATFALANSLAGVLVGPLVVGAAVAAVLAVGRRAGGGGMALPLLLAAPVLAAILACLVLTKSRSAYLGLLVGLGAVFWSRRRALRGRTPRRVLLGGLALAGVIVAAGVATGQLDRQVLTESSKSLGYRGEYWRSTWSLLSERSRTFWSGVGPGNFSGPYLRHKLAVSSEEIKDPHNLVLEVWAASGVLAALALVVAVGAGVVGALRPGGEVEPDGWDLSTGWLWWSAGLGGWLLVVVLGKLDPVVDPDDLMRWLVLGLGWGLAALGLRLLWRRVGADGPTAGGGALAVAVNLFAAGAVGFPPVALALWAPLALGLVLRGDRACGRMRPIGGRWAAFGLAAVAAALVGSFVGGVLPGWRSEALLARAEAVLARRPPDFDAARQLVLDAASADRYASAPWTKLAEVEYRAWLAEGARPDADVGLKVTTALDRAVAPPRDPNALRVYRLRIGLLRDLIARQGASLAPQDAQALREDLANAAGRAVLLYPTNATLHAELADAAAAIGRTRDAARHAREALRLDSITPHEDKKLLDGLREHLKGQLGAWDAQAAAGGSSP
jgi:hypothetical protein